MIKRTRLMAEKKQVPLRISEQLFKDISRWAEDDFRSINGQIEYLLTECVKQHKKTGAYVGKDIDPEPDFDVKDFD